MYHYQLIILVVRVVYKNFNLRFQIYLYFKIMFKVQIRTKFEADSPAISLKMTI